MDFHGVKMAVTHFVTQFTHVSRHFGVCSRKQNKNYLGKTVLKMWSQILRKMACVSTKLLLEKNEEKKEEKNNMKTFKIFGGFWGQN